MMSRARAFLRLTQSLIEKIQQGSEIFKEHPISNTNESMTQQNTKNTKSEKSRKPWTNNKE